MDAPGDAPFEPYLPRLVRDWAARAPAERWRELDGTLVSVDLSGFTALAERLAGEGPGRRRGAGAGDQRRLRRPDRDREAPRRRRAQVPRRRAPASLLRRRATPSAPAARPRRCSGSSRRPGETMSSVGAVSCGCRPASTPGTCHFFLVESSHRELVVAGPGRDRRRSGSRTSAGAGEVLVSAATAAAVEPAGSAASGAERGCSRSTASRRRGPADVEDAADRAAALELEPFVPVALRDATCGSRPARRSTGRSTAAFVKFAGVEALLARAGTGRGRRGARRARARSWAV